MKEIIEYILAALIIISIIPVITYIENTVYSPRPRQVEPIVLQAFSNHVINIINSIVESGNLTAFQPSIFNTILKNNLSQFTTEYGYNITIQPYVIKIESIGQTTKVVTLYNGTLTILYVPEDPSLPPKNISSNNPEYNPTNNMFIYNIWNPYYNTKLLLVIAILNVGTQIFIDYKILDDSIPRLSMINLNGNLCIAYMASNSLPFTSASSKIIYYDQSLNTFYVYRYINYNYQLNNSVYRIVGYNTLDEISERYFQNVKIDYEARYLGTYNLYNNQYYIWTLNVNLEESISYNNQTYNYTGTRTTLSPLVTTTTVINTITSITRSTRTSLITTSLPVKANITATYIKITNTTLTASSTYQTTYPSKTRIYEVGYPILNTVVILLVDPITNKYVGIVFPYINRLTVGSTIPINWPTSTSSFWIKIGMFTYYVTIAVWRKTL